MLENLESAMKHVGDAGRYQLRVFGMFCLVIVFMSLQIMSPTYTYIEPEYLCDGFVCVLNTETCQQQVRVSPEFRYQNIVTTFSLYCDRHYLRSVLQSSNFLGSAIGGSLLSYMAVRIKTTQDRVGRAKIYILSWTIASMGMLGIYLSTNVWLLIIATSTMGFGQIGSYILAPVILNEVCGQKLRQFYTLSILTAWSISEMIAPVLFYYFRDWRTIQLYFIALPAILVLILLFLFLKETPKFYYSKSKQEQVNNYQCQLLESLNYIAAINQQERISQITFHTQEVKNTNYGFFDLFRIEYLKLPSIGFMLISYSLHLLYYSGQYGLDSISTGNMIYIIGIAVGLGEFFTYLVMSVLVYKMARKRYLMISYIICIACCFTFLLFGIHNEEVECEFCTRKILFILLACLVRVFNTLGFGLQGLFANEFYPTPLRALGTGFLFSVGIFGSFSSPYVILFAQTINMNPFVLAGALSIVGPIGTMLTKETLNKSLKDTVMANTVIESEID